MRPTVLALVLSLVGCGSSTPTSSTTPVAIAPTIEVAPEHVQSAPEVVLDARGEGTPRLLRFAPVAGATHAIVMTMDIEVAMSLGGNAAPPTRAPRTTMTSENHVREVAADGSFRIDNRLTGVEVEGDPNDPMVAAYRAQLEPLTRVSGWSAADPRGRVLGIELVIPDDLNPASRQSVESVRDTLRQLLPSLPEEPVAPGARWHWEAPLATSNGITLINRVSYELLEVDEVGFMLAVQVDQRAEPQSLPSTPEASAELLSMSGRGEGRVSLRFDGGVRSSAMSVAVEARTRVTQGESSMDVGTRLRLVTEITGR
ncbi:MAG: hypothetical protein MUE69_08745 [Myxococcota bacterium]|jgi:hypothetical protein|nr:hypothetical protein [Myxococcota bacterium]